MIGFVIWTVCVHKHCNHHPNHEQDLHTARWYFVPTMQIDPCMASACISKMHTHESRSERALHSQRVKSGFLGRSRSKTLFFSHFKCLIWKNFAFSTGKIRLSNQESDRITFWNSFPNVIGSFVNRATVWWQRYLHEILLLSAGRPLPVVGQHLVEQLDVVVTALQLVGAARHLLQPLLVLFDHVLDETVGRLKVFWVLALQQPCQQLKIGFKH